MSRYLIAAAAAAGVAASACTARAPRQAGAEAAATTASAAAPFVMPDNYGPRPYPRPKGSYPTTSEASGASGIDERVIHFEVDSVAIDEDAGATLQRWADYLAANRRATVTVEGHADERGDESGNRLLAERRARAVRQALIQLGAGPNQVRVASRGESSPVETAHDESAWSLNRRVEIVD
ncbi:MAG: OmpA family protein [Gammaproteobacteria bacterium]|nr:OmpA family protein [Gammaproteobacteria bacterium]